MSAPASLHDDDSAIKSGNYNDDMFTAGTSRLNATNLDDNSSGSALLSFNLDSKPKTPVDRIQDDFPGTPSLYSSQVSRLSSIAEGFDSSDSLLPSSRSPRAAGLYLQSASSIDAALDRTTASMQQLNMNAVVSTNLPPGSNSLQNISGLQPLTNTAAVQPLLPAAAQNRAAPGRGNNGVQSFNQYGNVQYVAEQPLQSNYYVQQPVYVDSATGQPVYYRVAGNQYTQDIVYASQEVGSTDIYGTGVYGSAPINAGSTYYANSQDNLNQGYAVAGADGNMRRVLYPNNAQQQYAPNRVNQNYQGIPGQQMNNMRGMDHIDMYGVRDTHGGIGRNNLGMDSRNDRNLGMNRNDGYRDRDRGGSRNNRANDRYNDRNSQQNNSAVNPMRDPLVDEFRLTYGKSRQWGLTDLLGHVVAFCQDQHGSRFIQQRLEVCPDADKQLIFEEIMPSAPMLMTDVFGNYVLQKLFEFGTSDQCDNLSLLLTGQCVTLSMQMYGCRVVQKALEYVSTPRLMELLTEFENPPVLLRCVYDSNGNHVIQKCIEIVSKVAREAAVPETQEILASRIQFILDTFKGKVKELASHPYGCRVVQRTLEHCNNEQKKPILEELRDCCAELVQDCYGNYVIQFIMQHGMEADRQVLIKEVQARLLDFSQHKFASNVVEKCLQYASKRDRDEMIWTIINVTFDLNSPVDAKTGHCVLESMVRDPYANYVVQKVIDVSDERQRNAIMAYVRENITQLRRLTYAKHILVRLEKLTNEKF